MLRQIIAITLKELNVVWVDREALALLFAMPMFFILVMSLALQGVFEAGTKGRPVEVLVINPNGGPLAEQAIPDLKGIEGLTLIETGDGVSLSAEKAEALIRRGDYPLALSFVPGFSERILQARGATESEKGTVILISDPATNLQLLASVKGVIRSTIERRVQRAQAWHRLCTPSFSGGLERTSQMVCGATRNAHEHLLIVDDDEEMRDLLRKVLEKEGYRVSVAADGRQALALLAQGSFDLVVTDMLMPQDGGLELLETLHRSHPNLPVIIVTAFGDWHSYTRALQLGAAAFISKPLRMSELIAAVHNALAGSGATASP